MDEEQTEDTARRPALRLMLRVMAFFMVAALLVLMGGFFMGSGPRTGLLQVFDNLSVFETRLQNIENATVLHERRLAELEQMVRERASAPTLPPVETAAVPPAIAEALPFTPNATAETPAAAEGTDMAEPTIAAAPAVPQPPAVDEARVIALEKELAALRAALPSDDAKAQSARAMQLLGAFHRLANRVTAGKPFKSEAAAFGNLVEGDEAFAQPLAALAPYADLGVPQLAELLVTFDAAVSDLESKQSVPPTGSGAWDRFKHNLSHLVTVRRIDEAQTGKDAAAVVGRAAAKLDRGEIEAAIAEIGTLPEHEREGFAAWLNDARIALEAPGLVDQIEEEVMQGAFNPESAKPAAAEQGNDDSGDMPEAAEGQGRI